ncbi:unnamed protein product [Phytomonas sp. EM1]|nr:unnamed protein product [Phytomonas sp. EM1]|eukprot:CCW65102.1 unnamed protein product [Phytomonas sp. isolate EM1]
MKRALSEEKGERGQEGDTDSANGRKIPLRTPSEYRALDTSHTGSKHPQNDSVGHVANVTTPHPGVLGGNPSTQDTSSKTGENGQATRRKRAPKLYFFHQSDILSPMQPTSLPNDQLIRGNRGAVSSSIKPKRNMNSSPCYCVYRPYSGDVHPRPSQRKELHTDHASALTSNVESRAGVASEKPLPGARTSSLLLKGNQAERKESREGGRLVEDPVFAHTLSVLAKARNRPPRRRQDHLTAAYETAANGAELVGRLRRMGPSRHPPAPDDAPPEGAEEGPPPSAAIARFSGLPQIAPWARARAPRETGSRARKSRADGSFGNAPAPSFVEARHGSVHQTPSTPDHVGRGVYRGFSASRLRGREAASQPRSTVLPCGTEASSQRASRGASRGMSASTIGRDPTSTRKPSRQRKPGARLGETQWDSPDDPPTTPATAVDDEEEEEEGGDAGSKSIMVNYMPKGRYVIMNLLSNWGDDYEIGICGVELFNEHGQIVIPDEAATLPSSYAQPRSVTSANGSVLSQEEASSSVNHSRQTMDIDSRQVVSLMYTTRDGLLQMLAEYSSTGEEFIAMRSTNAMEEFCNNPRRQLCNIIRSPYNTHDENAMFAIPYTHGQDHLLCFMFATPITLSMIRIHNYSGKGRVHTTKGVRMAEITMDDILVFHGEIAQSSGEWTTDPLQRGIKNCENILFTQELCILRRILRFESGVDSRVNSADGDEHESGALGSRGGERVLREPSQSGTAHGERPHTSTNHATKGTTFVFYSNSDQTQNYVGGRPPAAAMSSQLSGLGACPPTGSILASAQAEQLQVRPSTTGLIHPTNQPSLQSVDRCTSFSPGTTSLFNPSVESIKTTKKLSMPPNQLNSFLPCKDNTWVEALRADGDGGDPPQSGSEATSHYTTAYPSQCPKQVSSACFMFLSTWGDTQYVGLSGLRLRDAHGNSICAGLKGVFVQYPDGSHVTLAEQEAFKTQVGHLFDECPDTACLLPFFPGMELVLVFDTAIETLGFLDVANYSVGEHTYCGAKEVRLFLSLGLPFPSAPQRGPEHPPPPLIYEHLWTLASSGSSRRVLQQARVLEVTPSEGVALRKAPAHFRRARFQTYDLSLGNPYGGEIEGAEWGGGGGSANVEQMDRFYIGVGPGTGGDAASTGVGFFKDAEGPKMQCVPTLAGATSSREGSLTASMNIRATMAMRRARMLLRDWPDWLLDYQPYITPLLPVGYVLKVCLTVCARSVGSSVGLPTTTSGTNPNKAGEAARSLFPGSVDSLKAYLKEWILQPFASCAFVNEDGRVIRAVPPGEDTAGAGLSPGGEEAHVLEFLRRDAPEDGAAPSLDEDAGGEGSCAMHMVAESLVSTLPAPVLHHGTDAASAQLQLYVELAYVSDTPFCLSVLGLNRPLVLDGAAAWVKNILVRMDDTLIYDSGDAALRIARGDSPERSTRQPSSDQNPPLPPCVSSLKPIIIFTLDTKILESLKQNVVARQKSRIVS